MANESTESPLTPSQKGVLREKAEADERAIQETHQPFEDEAERERKKALEGHFSPLQSKTETDLDTLHESLVKEQDQPILDEHTRLETEQLAQLQQEARQIKSQSRQSAQLARLKARNPVRNKQK